MSKRFGLVVRFTAVSDNAAGAFDQLANGMLDKIKTSPDETGTLVYSIHSVPQEPRVRVFYELYESRQAHKKHLETQHFKEFEYMTKSLLKEFGGCVITDLGMVADKGLPKPAGQTRDRAIQPPG